MNEMILNRIIERAAYMHYQTFGQVDVIDCISMAIGEAEVYFNTDFDLKITNELCQSVLKKSEKLGELNASK